MSISVKPGQQIPEFGLPASTGQTLTADSFRGKMPVAFIFLPDLESDLSVSLLGDLNVHLADFGSERSQILGVVKEVARKVRRRADELEIRFPILADAAGEMSRDFGVVFDEESEQPVLVIADRGGRLVRGFDPAPTEGLVDAALTTIRSLGSGAVMAYEDG
ncbi:MAG: redoxin domain-containing protein [Acidimicrobiia bacterium]